MDCLFGCSLVLVPAGMPRKPGMTRDDLFRVNADIAKGIVEACARWLGRSARWGTVCIYIHTYMYLPVSTVSTCVCICVW